MCGIAAFFAWSQAADSIDPGEVERVTDAMAVRGPDGRGVWIGRDRRVALGHRRLAIQDLDPRAGQPMASGDGRLRLAYNGELYGFHEDRAALEVEGHHFDTTSDTEVLLALLARDGEAALPRLRGMYAFALWDERRGALLLARDPYGIKPLYFAEKNGVLRAASQVKALRAGGAIDGAVDDAGLAGFYLTGSVPEPFTLFREIHALPAGQALWVDERGVRGPRVFYSVASTLAQAVAADPAPRAEVAEREVVDALRDSVRRHLIADVPVGLFLSAGIDSGALLGLASEVTGEPLRTVTLAFDEYRGTTDDESPLAERVAAHYGARHSTQVLTRADFRAALPELVGAMDQPSIDGVNTWCVSRAASQAGLTVALSGLGGDELFGGYPAFRQVPRSVASLGLPSRIPGLGRLSRAVLAALLPSGLSPKLAGLLEYGGEWAGAYLLRRGLFLPWELPALMGTERARAGLERLAPLENIGAALDPDPGGAFARVVSLESSLYMRNQLLRDTDWASMAHSLEVRVPLVDTELLERVAPLIAARAIRPGKAFLGRSPRRALPKEITDRPKSGFTVPIARWLEDEPELDVWRRLPQLARPGCPWARRWAYTVASMEVEPWAA
ncbi:asparagine synthase (glutamine-hydrolyzing) [Engelhardtia mirabilis]|uniref:asparagine synthase (glutamine-hydrolyzing) n=1 Tax=Engelhardtia mirabilis TaxID=2528011 RepID=A0A518BJH4_9BACT|nr:Asparagine synthetase [glutamine-hydrolyzing] 1 [Planctomycetes bacterium Pla133]QDV01466.1 Asparagine synthetase [glutamine-hydrolyzing] 1 [Planctomycetes bacterium Pla86]